LDYKEKLNEIVTNFIYEEGYEEDIIEQRLTFLINEQIENIYEVDVYFCCLSSVEMKIEIILKIIKEYDPIKCRYLFDTDILLNSKRKFRLQKILD
jgi:hypothetical protein